MLSNDFYPKKPNIFCCEKCDFVSSNKRDYFRHIDTIKHKINLCQYLSMSKNPKPSYVCACGKTYKDNSGLWRHKKKCEKKFENNIIQVEEKILNTNEDKDSNSNEINELKEFMKYLIKENTEMKTMMCEVIKNGTHNINTINTNSHNKTFNLNMFLNETCKHAMNISDFANSIELELSDLIDVGELGYVNGISNIIIKNLKQLDITKRPIHCTDVKRETIYIKDADKWEKENEQNEKIISFVKKIANKNIRMLNVFKNKYPDCIKSESKKSDQYNKLVIEAMGGYKTNYTEQYEKIVKRISKEVTIDKSNF